MELIKLEVLKRKHLYRLINDIEKTIEILTDKLLEKDSEIFDLKEKVYDLGGKP